MKSTVPGWEQMNCKCGNNLFVEVKHLRWSQSGGTVAEPKGWQCAKCGFQADMARLIQEAKLKQKKTELAAIQAEIGESTPTRSPSSKE